MERGGAGVERQPRWKWTELASLVGVDQELVQGRRERREKVGGGQRKWQERRGGELGGDRTDVRYHRLSLGVRSGQGLRKPVDQRETHRQKCQ